MSLDLSRQEIIKNISEHMRSLYASGNYYVHIPPGDGADYEESYWNTIIDPDGKERNRLEERELFLSDIDYVVTYLKTLPPGKVLDIGCGLGWLLSALPATWEKHGLELSKTAAKFAEQYGRIFTGPFSESSYPENYFDVIFIHHVIEHMEKPEDEIKNIKRVLKSGGILILGTPDFDSGCARLFGENYRLLHDKTHISLFSNDSMHRFLRDNNFEIFRVEYPFFETRFFTKDNLSKLFDTKTISPPFYGNFMTFFCKNKKV